VQSSLNTEPPGATVSIRNPRDAKGAWTVVGRTPIVGARLPRGVLRWRIELGGYDTEESFRLRTS
jgi:hypothetical protein